MRKRGSLFVVVLLLFGSLFFLSNSASAAAKLCVLNDDCAYTQYCGWFECQDLSCAGRASWLCSGNADCSPSFHSYGSYGNYCGLVADTVPQNHKCVSILGVSECLPCAYPSADCNLNGGCETNLASDVSNCGSCGKTCQSGWSCESGSCKAPEQLPCKDNDKDGYGNPGQNNCPSGSSTDCNDNNANVYPGSCSPDAVTWSGSCSTSGTGGCGSGTCTRALPSVCGDVCGVGGATGTEACDWGTAGTGSTICGGNGNDPAGSTCTTTVSCPNGYPGVTGKYRCNSACSGFVYDTSGCGKCGDGKCESPETKASCPSDCEKCGNGVLDSGEVCDAGSTKTQTCPGGYPSVTATCRVDCSGYEGICPSCGDGVVSGPETCEPGHPQVCPGGQRRACSPLSCTWQDCPAVVTPQPPTCTDGKQNGDEAGVDCGGSKCDACKVCTPNQVVSHSCSGCGTASETVCNADGTGTGPSTWVADSSCKLGCPSAASCAGVELDDSQGCCVASGFEWVKSGERDAGAGPAVFTVPSCGVHDWKKSDLGGVGSLLGGKLDVASVAALGKVYYAVLSTAVENKGFTTVRVRRTSTVGNCALGFCWYDDNLGAWYGYFDEQQPVTITIPVVSVVSANFDGSGSVKTVFKLSCPGGVECAKGASGFKVRAYNGKVYFAWASANIYSYSVDASSLIGGSKVGSASVAVSGSSIGLFDFWADKDGVEYVYVKDNRERVFDDDGDSQLSGCGVGSGVYSSKKGLIAPWPRNRNYDQYGCAGSFWGAPVIAREGGKSYYVWGEVTDWLGTANSYLIKVAVRGGGVSSVGFAGESSRTPAFDQLYKSGLGAAVVNGVVYYSFIVPTGQSSAVNIATFNPANSADGVAFGSSMSGYASGSTRLVSVGNVVLASWAGGIGAGFTYGSSASEMQAHHDALVSGLLTGSPVAAVGSGYVVGRPGFAQVSCTGGQEELSQKVASKMLVDTQFQDSKGERKATTKLLPNEERCFGDDLNEDFFVRVRDCKVGVCTSDLFDRVLCDKQSDCVYAGKCYSDVKLVASTFFGSDLAGVWGSNWKSEVSADVHGDGKVEVCDPGQWQNPAGAVAGMVTDSTTAASIGGVTVNMVGTPPNQGIAYSAITAADGTYVVSSVDAFTYDVTASKSGYVDVVKANQPVLPFQTNVVDFQLLLAAGNVVGTVRNVSGEPVGGAAVRVLGTAFSGVTSPAGTYSISSVPSGTYDVVASKASDGYDDATALSIGVTSGSTTADFTLIRALGSCTNDCTKVGSNICDVSCDGKGLCKFYSVETEQACDGTFGIIGLSGGRQVSCCKGQPYTPIKADVVVKAKQLVKTVKPVLYKGKLVNLVTLLFIPDKQG